MKTFASLNDERIYRAKRWGKAHGYIGRSGGWIYYNDRPFCQGYGALFRRRQREIEAWEQRTTANR